MSKSKVNRVLEQAAIFEKLALYGNRRDYLRAISQVNFPNVDQLLQDMNNLKNKVVKQTNQFWRQDPANFSMPEREAYNSLAYTNSDTTVSNMDELVNHLNDLYTSMSNGNEENKQFAQNTIYPAVEQMKNYSNQYSNVAQNLNDLNQPSSPKPTNNIPEVLVDQLPVAKNETTPVEDPKKIKDLQVFLNEAFRNDIIEGKKGPIGEDGRMGPETSQRLQEWALNNSVKGNSTAALMNSALNSKVV